ncbi:amino acid adenylation domain-containing protein [Nocardia cyriacigeorgica]|uniref:Plipastatin synthase subunit B n=1 Tax=Nocardia cyriacigeorgica TaxID=135487 RepID=A0A4U8W3D9_9NOCA|nr:amino acid adenylation domain-containing protein [Nocardia cyriacigeorgica]VFA99399.1 Plipastatin synthase subunit B [Nocardia cyriacigeorgica]
MTPTVKCLVWDLDETVWDGVVLEHDAGPPRPWVWDVLRLLDQRGIVHAIASRGIPEAAAAHLDEHGLTEMFCATQIGWGAKSAAVHSIAETLNIGLDAIAFVDNDPVERAEVAAALPEVRCYDAADIARLPDLPEFTPPVITDDARQRRLRYRAEQERRTSEAGFTGSDAEFLASLGLVMTVRRATDADLARAHELTVRTNQLNTTGRTFDIDELRELALSPSHEVLVASLRDRFGDYGAIGLAVTESRGDDAVILLLLMSCRVMSRGVGGALLAHLIERAGARGQRCVAEFVPTEVNRVMLVTLRFAGFTVLESTPERVLLAHDGASQVATATHVLLRAPDAPVPPGDLLTGLMRQIERVPERTAVVVGERSLTYRELDSATRALAGRLVSAGVRPGQVVLYYLRQDLDTVVGMIAALRAGAAWCVIEPGYPKAALAALLGDLDIGAIVVDPSEPSTQVFELASPGITLLTISQAEDGHGSGDVPGDRTGLPATAPAYVVTTSGSTGTPKAVVVSRANVAAMISARDYPYRDGHVVSLSTWRLTADGSLMFALWTWVRGGTAVFPTHRELPDASAVAETLRRHEVTHLASTPSFYRLLLAQLTGTSAGPKVVALAGEALTPALAATHQQVLPEAVLINEYGPTEATVTCVWHTVTGTPDRVPIGTPMPGSTALVLGPDLTPATGGAGELYLGGGQVTDGYAARPGLTATRFVADPYATEPGARMYRTGDLARRGEDGAVEYLGRGDGQVKVRGARVERHAVEALLETHSGVRHAVVLDVRDADEVNELVAFIVAAEPTAPTPRELTEFCAEHLEPLTIPSRFLSIATIPIGAAGKMDEAALRALARGPRTTAPARDRSGWTQVQCELAELWAEVLEHDEFDRDDSFFELGGNSHRVVFLHLGIEQRWPGAVRVGMLFDLFTIAAQAEAISAARTGAAVATGHAEPAGDEHGSRDNSPSTAPVAFEL